MSEEVNEKTLLAREELAGHYKVLSICLVKM